MNLDIPGIVQHQTINKQTFVLGDNMALLRYMKEEMMMGYFHLGIVDPPYGINVGDMKLGATKDSKPRDYEMGKWDGEVPNKEYWELLRYVCRKLIVWGGNYFTKEIDFSGRCFIVWDKGNDKVSFAPCELALTDFDRNACFIRKGRNAQEQDGKKRHPTQKPVYVYDYIHSNFVEKNWRVLDTHGGSFSHAIAAYKNNSNLVIIDREESYYKSGIEEYKEQAKPRLIF